MSLLTIPKLSERLSISANRFRKQLEQYGYIELDEEGRWKLTPKGKEAGGKYYNFYGKKLKFPEDFEFDEPTNVNLSSNSVDTVAVRKSNLEFDFFRDVYLRDVSLSKLDTIKNNPVYQSLDRGKKGLENEKQCFCYSACYAGMHYYKLQNSFEFAENNSSCFDNLKNLEIFDWGCGQGYGSSILLEFLETNLKFSGNILFFLTDISKFALNRGYNKNIKPSLAKNNINNSSNKIAFKKIAKSINDLVISDISDRRRDNFLDSNAIIDQKFIHIFSNILDVSVVNETKIAKLLFNLLENESYKGEHYFFCMSPVYGSAKSKILKFVNQFKNRFNNRFSKIRETSEPITNIEYYDFLPQKKYKQNMSCTRYEIQFSIVN